MRKIITFLLLHVSFIVHAQTCIEVPITNQTYSTTTTIYGCTVNLNNVNVENSANLIVNTQNGVTFSGEFNLNAGSVFETGFANITVPTLGPTTPATYVSQTAAVSGGEVIDDGGSPITEKGICWNTSENPTIDDYHTLYGEGGTGSFSVVIMNLSSSTTYWVRAYATNAAGTSYGTPISFTTPQATAALTQAAVNGGPTGVLIQYTVTLSDPATDTKIFSVTHTNTTNTGTVTENITVNIGTRTGTLDVVYQNQINPYNALCDFNGPQTGFTVTSSQLSFFMAALLKPTLAVTTAASSITQTTATSGGNVTDDGGTTVSERGICWSTSDNPTIDGSSKATSGTGTGNFTANLTGLSPSTTYYVRAYATNSAGTTYGSQISFTTQAPPVVVPTLASTTTVTSIGQTTATSGGNVTSDGGATVTERGICWSSGTTSPTKANSYASNGAGTGSYSVAMTGLLPSTTYYVRSYAINSAGTGYGAYTQFTTIAPLTIPVLDPTYAAYAIYHTTAQSGGNITSDGGATVNNRGICWSTSSNPTTANSVYTTGTGTGSFTGYLTGLTPATTYYIRSFATNSVGTGYGSQVSFSTPAAQIPTVDPTTAVTNISASAATSGGYVASGNGSAVTARGVCWSTSPNPTVANSKTVDGSGGGSFTSNITGLSPNTLYYVRAYATNAVGTGYGSQVSFTTSSVGITASISYQVFSTQPTSVIVGWFANLTAPAPSSNTIPCLVTNSSGSGTHSASGYVAQGQQSSIMIETVTYSRLAGSNYNATCTFGTLPSGYVAGSTGVVTIPKQ